MTNDDIVIIIINIIKFRIVLWLVARRSSRTEYVSRTVGVAKCRPPGSATVAYRREVRDVINYYYYYYEAYYKGAASWTFVTARENEKRNENP